MEVSITDRLLNDLASIITEPYNAGKSDHNHQVFAAALYWLMVRNGADEATYAQDHIPHPVSWGD